MTKEARGPYPGIALGGGLLFTSVKLVAYCIFSENWN